jgi:hypothetical protein
MLRFPKMDTVPLAVLFMSNGPGAIRFRRCYGSRRMTCLYRVPYTLSRRLGEVCLNPRARQCTVRTVCSVCTLAPNRGRESAAAKPHLARVTALPGGASRGASRDWAMDKPGFSIETRLVARWMSLRVRG